MSLAYMPGFGNDFETESLPGALPQGQNSPQRCAYGLYAEQLSGSPFTAPRGTNERSWLYRIRPSVRHTTDFRVIDRPYWRSAPAQDSGILSLGQRRWDPTPYPEGEVHFLDSLHTITTAGDVVGQAGMATHIYALTADMEDDYFFNADGEMMIVPQEGALKIFTEMGIIEVAPLEIVVLPRGMMFKVMRGEGVSGRAVMSAKITAPSSRFPNAGRSAPTAWPTRATSRPRWRPMRTARCLELHSQMVRPVPRHRRSGNRRSTWWPGTATTRPTSTT
jgi:homogentisate 1,2-dioxygenase